MPMHERNDDEVQYKMRACPDEYMREGKVTWMDFLKVARTEENTTLSRTSFGRLGGSIL